jgi:hypothetical protein
VLPQRRDGAATLLGATLLLSSCCLPWQQGQRKRKRFHHDLLTADIFRSEIICIWSKALRPNHKGDITLIEFLKEKAVAIWLGVSVSTLRRWRCQGNGPLFRKLNSRVRYDPTDVQSFSDDRARLSTNHARDGSFRDNEHTTP